jgi:predicted ATPase
MFIGFLGPPMSGKTTIAAKIFAELKERGYPAEFIAERARWFIAKKKYEGTLVLPLTDQDQEEIMSSQDEAETVMSASSDAIVIADSCILNSYFYQSTPRLRKVVGRYASRKNLLYFSDVLPIVKETKDPNRVHSIEEARKISAQMKKFMEGSIYKIRPLAGSVDMRVDQVLRDTYDLYNGG